MGVKLGAQLKCIYTNAHSMGNKQDELEAIVRQDSNDIVAITETWWDDSHDWNAAMNGYKLFRRNSQGRRGGGVALYIRECFGCIELDSSDDEVECLWIRMKGKANKGDFVLGVCYRPPNQGEEADDVFYKWLAEVSPSVGLRTENSGENRHRKCAVTTVNGCATSLGGDVGERRRFCLFR
ncbi:mitochondrial fission process protein 1 [Limosa lapponica baueri]|uniref:Mitochondrial fission process protein 1 n=1 Tax=Limosa lapponica baueri TaxID=1758121 RepID=A0A2I0U7D9_LIMLA|nr:mitochondrial fission process protein 1 [Limosa lapponica baueri]